MTTKTTNIYKAKSTDIHRMVFSSQAEANLADALWNIRDESMDINDFYRLLKFTLRMAGAESEWSK